MSLRAFFLAGLLAGLLPSGPLRAQAAAPDPGLFSALRARNIGPAGMSGRVAAVAVDPSDPGRIFVGAATGGLLGHQCD